MKRKGNLWRDIISIDNLREADRRARKGKTGQFGVKLFDRSREKNFQILHDSLVMKTFSTSDYSTFKIFDPKERLVFRLPYYPDRIVHHAIMVHLEKIFVSSFTADTYSCIKGRGIHAASNAIMKAFRDVPGTKYCLKMDITKFYPSVDHDILKQLLRKKIKDKNLLWLLDNIIDSAEGVPIGNYLSQYLANFYLTYFDHWLKEILGVKYYIRYADDMVIFSGSKDQLREYLAQIIEYLDLMKLKLKANYQIFPVAARGVDMVGYVHWHDHKLLRKSIKKRFLRMLARNYKDTSLASYMGWLKHCNSRNLMDKIILEYC